MSEVRKPGVKTSPLSLYIHWPFCLSKCPYCDFNSHVAAAPVDHDKWLDALLREMQNSSARIKNAHLVSIFFGGGTPSLMSPRSVARLITGARALWPATPDLEVTLEANPTSAEYKKFQTFAEAGVNRLSLGIQALNNTDLKRLGRRHNVDGALAALAMGKQTFERVSFDLIYARQKQNLKSWEAELNRAIELSTGHLSLYQLTIEPRTAFFDAQASGKLKLPDSDRSREFYDLTQEVCGRAGLPAYEISNHARPGHESAHNLAYWRSNDYLGIGPGAHSRLGGCALANESDPQAWLEQVKSHGHGRISDTRLDPLECAEEMLLMGLRLTEGLDLKLLSQRTGYQIAPSTLSELANDGLIIIKPANTDLQDKHCLAVTTEGRPVLNSLIHLLVANLHKNIS